MSSRRFFLLSLIGMIAFASSGRAEVTAEKSDRGVVIKIDGQLFTEYLTKAGQQPALYPVIGPGGKGTEINNLRSS